MSNLKVFAASPKPVVFDLIRYSPLQPAHYPYTVLHLKPPDSYLIDCPKFLKTTFKKLQKHVQYRSTTKKHCII